MKNFIRVVKGLSALAHDARLEVFRLLVQAGAEGMTAGAITAELNVSASTISPSWSEPSSRSPSAKAA